jgi:hypothetical protein
MDASVLQKLFGKDQRWHGPCTIIMNGDAALKTHGSDSIVAGGVKMYAPRTVSGRVCADAVCLLEDASAFLIVQQHKTRQETGEESVKQFLIVANPGEVIAVEFQDTTPLAILGIHPPTIRSVPGSLSHHGTYARPAQAH